MNTSDHHHFPDIYQSVRTTLRDLARRAATPTSVQMERTIQHLLEFHQRGPIRWAFYLIADLLKGELLWQHDLDRALGFPSAGLTLPKYLQRIHPTYIAMYLAWLDTIHHLRTDLHKRAWEGQLVYHITLPLLHNDQNYYWFTQRSFALQDSPQGGHAPYFHLYDYSGPWNMYNRRPFLPFLTNYHHPDPALEAMLFDRMAINIKAGFTPTECYLLEWYMAGEPSRKIRMAMDTRHDHNAHILQKARTLFCCDFSSARVFAWFLRQQGLWPPQDVVA